MPRSAASVAGSCCNYDFFRRSAQRFFIISEIRLRASGDIFFRRRRGPAGAAVSSTPGRAADAAAPRAGLGADPRAKLVGLRRQGAQAVPRLDNLPLEASQRPADQLGGLDQDLGRVLARSSSGHLTLHEPFTGSVAPYHMPMTPRRPVMAAVLLALSLTAVPGTASAQSARELRARASDSRLQPGPRRGDRAPAPGGRPGAQRARQPPRARLDPLAQHPLPARRSHRRSLSRQLHAGERRGPQPARGSRRRVQARDRARDRAVGGADRRGAARPAGAVRSRRGSRPAGDLHGLGRRTADGRVQGRAPQLRRRRRPSSQLDPEAEGGRAGRRHLPVPRLDAVAPDAPDGLRRPASAAARNAACG